MSCGTEDHGRACQGSADTAEARSHTPPVSVIMPTYNCARYLPEAIGSVLAQTYRDFEIVVVDDGSTDNTQEVLAGYGDRIRAIRQPNQGRSAARNTGIMAARGEYIAFLDADDLWLPRKLERQMALFGERPELKWVYSDYCRFGEGGRHPVSVLEANGLRPPAQCRRDVLTALLAANEPVVSVITVVVRATCFHEVGLYDVSMPVVEDLGVSLRLASAFEVGCVDEVLALYRRHPKQSTNGQHTELFARCSWRTFRQFVERTCRQLGADERAAACRIARRKMAECAYYLSQEKLSQGRRAAALLWLIKSFRACWYAPPHRLGLLAQTLLPTAAFQQLQRARRRVLQGRRSSTEEPASDRGRAVPPARSEALPPLPDEPSVSVIIPTRNRARLLEEALESVFAQTVPVREVIVVDDGSTDETEEVVACFPGVRLLRTDHVGPAAARNAGAAAATGALLAFLDSDDVWLPQKTARQRARLRERPEAALVYADYDTWDGRVAASRGFLTDYAPGCEGHIYLALLMRNRVCPSTVIVRADCFRSIGGFVTTPRLAMGEDWATWLRLAKKYPFAFVPEVLAYYRIHPGQNLRRAASFERSVKTVLDMEFGDASVPEDVQRLRRRRMAQFRTDLAREYHLEKCFGRAVLNAVRAFCWYPLSAAPLGVAVKAAARGLVQSVGISVARGDAAGV